jgi:hypothetical protein
MYKITDSSPNIFYPEDGGSIFIRNFGISMLYSVTDNKKSDIMHMDLYQVADRSL